jgi:hypothetical protein
LRASGPIAALAGAWLAALVVAQTPAPDLAADWALLRERLTVDGGVGPGIAIEPLDRSQRIRLLQGFLDKFRAHPEPAAPELLDARLRLGALLLGARDWKGAETAFQNVVQVAPETALDAVGRARYGLAQTRILQGDLAGGRRLLASLRDEFVGTRWSDHATIALDWLARDGGPACRVGEPAPEFGPRVDRSGHVQSRRGLFGTPAVLLFVSAVDPDSLESAWQRLRAARRAGLPDEQVLVFVLDADVGGRWTLAAVTSPSGDESRMVVASIDENGKPLRGDVQALATTAFSAHGGFLDPALRYYRVDAIPSCILIGPDGTLLARDPSHKRFAEMLRKLLR